MKQEYAAKRRALNLLRAALENERSSFITHWRTIADFVAPRKPRFDITDTNRGDRRNTNIIDSTATYSLRTLQSGMMAGVTSPARPWFRLTVQDSKLAELGAVKNWLNDVTNIMREVFSQSNLYKVLPAVYGDMGLFGTSAFLIEPDIDKVVRFRHLPIGSYCISVNERGKVDTFHREFRMTVRQLVMQFGYADKNSKEIDWSKFSRKVKEAWEKGRYEDWIDICHTIRPNPEYSPFKALAKYKKYESCYYEKGSYQNNTAYTSEDDRYLSESGYDNFPVFCPRWSVTGEDTYATDCPGMTAIGDIKALQVLQRLKGNAIEKMVKPPMKGPSALRNQRVSHVPGDITFTTEREGQKGLSTLYDMNFDLQYVLEDIRAHQGRVKTAFFEDLFLMMSNDERNQRATAEEIIERRSEKMIVVGPVLEQMNEDVFDPLMDDTFNRLVEREMIPEPPGQLQGMPLRIEYVSIMAQAQKLVGLSSLERFAGFATKIAADTQNLEILDKVDTDQLIDEYGNALGVNSRVIRPDEDVEAMRGGRQKAQAAQANAEALASVAGATKDLGQADVGGGRSALSQLIELNQAGDPLAGAAA